MKSFPLQSSLSLEKDGMSQDRPARPSRQPKRKQRAVAEPELSDPDDYGDFSEPRQEPIPEFNTVIVGDETETNSAVQNIQQVLTLSTGTQLYWAEMTAKLRLHSNTRSIPAQG